MDHLSQCFLDYLRALKRAQVGLSSGENGIHRRAMTLAMVGERKRRGLLLHFPFDGSTLRVGTHPVMLRVT